MPDALRALLAIWLLCLVGAVAAQGVDDVSGEAADEVVVVDAAPGVTATGIDAADLSAYVDGLVEQAMGRDGIAGVAVAVVDRDGFLLLRGYGLASLSPPKPVDPGATRFRLASVSKTFTYLLALDLVDAGELDLDRPVNDYLPAALHLPDDGYPPVLLRHLFTHSAGFEDSALGHLFQIDPDRVGRLDDYLVLHRPKRVRAPGQRAVYSNYSVALLGALVAHVSGVDFETLAERELFGPLAMASTTFREPGLRADDPRRVEASAEAGGWSQGFRRSGGGFAPQAFEHMAHAAPAGGASSTAADMGRYLRMLLRGGELDGVRVLDESAYARLVDAPLFRNAEAVGGFHYGFFGTRLGHHEVLGHGGATFWFHSGLAFAPELGIGLFVASNTDSGREFAAELAGRVIERYFPAARADALPTIPAGFDAQRFAGSYRSQRSNYSRAEKALLGGVLTVGATADGALVIHRDGQASRWLPEGGLVFREAEGQGRIVFREDARGRVIGFAGALGHVVTERVGPLGHPDTLWAALVLAGLTAVLVLTGAWLRRGRRSRATPKARRAALWLYLSALGWLAFGIGLLAVLWRIRDDATAMFYAYPDSLLSALLWGSPLLMLLAVVGLVSLPSAWRSGDWGFWRTLRHTLAAVVFAFAAALLWSWNLVGWKL
ncbi:MAG: serine hydrolase [Lysobacteraceae bacterium]